MALAVVGCFVQVWGAASLRGMCVRVHWEGVSVFGVSVSVSVHDQTRVWVLQTASFMDGNNMQVGDCVPHVAWSHRRVVHVRCHVFFVSSSEGTLCRNLRA